MDEERMGRMLSTQIRMMNRHLATRKKSLPELLKEEKPSVTLRDGMPHHFKKKELEYLKEILPPEKRRRLKLPIYIELASSRFGKGTARVCGRAEVEVVSRILGKERGGDEMFVYKPEVRVVRRKLPTSTQYMFTALSD